MGWWGRLEQQQPPEGEWSHRASPTVQRRGCQAAGPGGTTPRLCSIKGHPPHSEPTLGDSVSPQSRSPGSAQCILAPGSLSGAKWPPGPSVPLSFPVSGCLHATPSTAVFAKKVVLAERPPRFPLGGQALAAAARFASAEEKCRRPGPQSFPTLVPGGGRDALQPSLRRLSLILEKFQLWQRDGEL